MKLKNNLVNDIMPTIQKTNVTVEFKIVIIVYACNTAHILHSTTCNYNMYHTELFPHFIYVKLHVLCVKIICYYVIHRNISVLYNVDQSIFQFECTCIYI